MSAASKVKDVAKKAKGKVGGAGRDAKGRFKAGAAATQDAAEHVTVGAKKKKAKPAAK